MRIPKIFRLRRAISPTVSATRSAVSENQYPGNRHYKGAPRETVRLSDTGIRNTVQTGSVTERFMTASAIREKYLHTVQACVFTAGSGIENLPVC